jgi:AraC-like DNA-binding protein
MHAIRLIKPARPLRAYVRFYAQRSARIDDGTLVHPLTARATPLIEFILGDRIQVFSQGPPRKQTSPRAVVVGTQTLYRGYLQLRGAVDCFIIMFQPTGLHRLSSLPMHELTDRSHEAHSVLGAFVARMEQRLGESGTLGERVRIADEFLLHRSFHARSFDRIAAVASQILVGGGNGPIAALAGEAGLSVRQFERRFVQQVGMRPGFTRESRDSKRLLTVRCAHPPCRGRTWRTSLDITIKCTWFTTSKTLLAGLRTKRCARWKCSFEGS